MAGSASVYAAIQSLLQNYNELNSPHIDELHQEPSALEFMRYAASNRPFVVRGGCRHWQAYHKWSAQYLKERVGDNIINVAVTPLGNADAVVKDSNDQLIFIEPHEQQEPFKDTVHWITKQERERPESHLADHSKHVVKYAQTQNDNLRNEYHDIFTDVPSEISWARIALQKEPDAVNFWLGNSRSVTSLHKDNYENIYAQIRGQKHFVLLPPLAAPCVNEQELPSARYVQVDGERNNPRYKEDLQPKLQEPSTTIPCATWDPDQPNFRTTPFSSLAQPMRVTLHPGDLLYLPAMWYHKVSQSCSAEDDFSCAVNYWYDMEFSGAFWATNAFVRDVARSADA